MRRFATVRVNGVVPPDQDEIIITALGPNGGTRATLYIDPVNAALLVRALEKALEDYRK